MAWDKSETSVVFYCDSPSCDVTDTFNIAQTRETSAAPDKGSDFAQCWQRAQGVGWRSFKRGGRPWEYFCPKCGPDAEIAHREYNRQEQERERIKARNAI